MSQKPNKLYDKDKKNIRKKSASKNQEKQTGKIFHLLKNTSQPLVSS